MKRLKDIKLRESFSSIARSRHFRKFLPLVILIVGLAGMGALGSSRAEPKKQEAEVPGALVEVMTVAKENRRITVHGTGTVQARQEVSITPQVSGRVVAMSENFAAGGFFRKGEPLFQIEDADYRLAVEQAEASLARAEYDLATVDSQARIARLEWERLKLSSGAEANPLTLYEPQLKNARAGVASAQAALKRAELDLERTNIHAPFNCRVRSEQVDPGQYVRAGTSVALIAGTDAAEVVIPLPFDEMQWLVVPRSAGSGQGSPATVRFKSGDTVHEWQGSIVRSLGEVDARGRMARVVVSIADPYGLARQNRPPLEVGMFVEVLLGGKSLPAVFAVPRSALRDNSSVWTMDKDNQLRIQPVQVVRLEQTEAVVANGLSDGTRVVLTTVSGAADGMKLRFVSQQSGVASAGK
jgi:RND family efflux transporter MFP subunit